MDISILWSIQTGADSSRDRQLRGQQLRWGIVRCGRNMSNFLHHPQDDHLKEKGRAVELSGIAPIAAWLSIRMSKPTIHYTATPRWHRDRRMYRADNDGVVNSKYAMTLLANLTRVLVERQMAA